MESWGVFFLGVIALGLAGHFAVDFAGARAIYGLPAAVHAWFDRQLMDHGDDAEAG